MSQLILYDLPSKGRCAAWSLNPWKTRLSLNYKSIDYKTEWTEYPDIEPRFKALNVPPNEKGTAYTIPVVQFPDGSYIMESFAIAQALEKKYPSPSLHLDYPHLQQVRDQVLELGGITVPHWIAKVPRNILNPKSVEYFMRTRNERLGMPLDEFEASQATEGKWEEAKPVAEKLGKLLGEKKGPFFMGETVSFADFVVAGFLHFFRRIDESVFEKVVGLDPSFKLLYDACGKWLERDDH